MLLASLHEGPQSFSDFDIQFFHLSLVRLKHTTQVRSKIKTSGYSDHVLLCTLPFWFICIIATSLSALPCLEEWEANQNNDKRMIGSPTNHTHWHRRFPWEMNMKSKIKHM